jgi:tRNA (guanine-N7-)-methyltransferase
MQKFLRSFGRIKGHKLSDRQQSLIESFLPQVKPINIKNLKKIWLEIGFGSGSHLIQLIEERGEADLAIIGCEPYINGAVKVLSYLEEQKSPKVFIQNTDARLLIDELSDQTVERIYILFPDPWPKNRHHKRRIIQPDFLQLLEKKLAINGYIIIATDHQHYAEWIATVSGTYQGLKILLESEEACKKEGILTNYCKKALQQGLPIHLFKITKTE